MKPNNLLKRERELRGWSQAKVAEGIGTAALNVSRWERGISMPYPHFREKLCVLFGKDAEALGLLESEEESAAIFQPPAPAAPPGFLSGKAVLDPAIPLPPPGNARLVGRDGLLKRLKGLLCGDAKPISVALNGLPGVGKTALAIDLAYDPEVRMHFQDGILWAGPGLKPDVIELLSRWGALLGVSAGEVGKESNSEAWAKAIRAAIGWRQMLLVIDDVWGIEDARALQVGGPCCAYLVTTRYPHLAVQLAAESALTVPELQEQDGLALLARYASEFVAQAPETALALVRSVGMLPLALTLVGKYLSVQVYSGQPRRLHMAVEHLRDAQTRLQLSETRALAERHPSMANGVSLSLQSVIAVSERLLDEYARSALRALSIFPAKPNSFAEEAALEICQTSLEILDRLCDMGLLESNGPSRYMLHQTIADYARTSLTDPTVSERLVSYYVSFVEEQAHNHELLVSETANILLAFEYAYQARRREELARGVCAFAPFLLMRGLYALAEKHLKRAYEATHVLGDTRRLIQTLSHLGMVERARTDLAQARASLLEGLELARQVGNEEQIGDLLTNLGRVANEQGNFQEAETYFSEGLALARQLGLPEQMCRLFSGLGVVAGKRGDYTRAEGYFQESLDLARQVQLHERIAGLLTNLGLVAMSRGHYPQAEASFLESHQQACQYDYQELAGAAQIYLGWVAGKQGRFAQARTYLSEALALLRQVGNSLWICQALAIQSDLLLAEEDEVSAERSLREGVELTRHFQRLELLGSLLALQGMLETRRGQYEQAEAHIQEALRLEREIGDMDELSAALLASGELSLRLQRVDEAEQTFAEMQQLAPAEHCEWQAIALFGLARVASARGEHSKARQQGQTSLESFSRLDHRRASDVANWLKEIETRTSS